MNEMDYCRMIISVSADGVHDCGSSMDVDEATTDSGIGLETLTQDGDSGVVGDSVNLSDERPFRSVQTPRAKMTQSIVSSDFSGCSSIDDFLGDTSSSTLSTSTTSSSTCDLSSLPRNFRQLLDGSLIGDQSATSTADVVSRRTTRSRIASDRRVDRPSARKLRFDECSPMATALRSTPSGVATHRMTAVSLADVAKCTFSVGMVGRCGENEADDDDAVSRDGFGDVTTALARPDDQLHNLIGDLSCEYLLPTTVNGKHADLKTISPDTLAALIAGDYSDKIERFYVIDCRYPYEYEGGHIENALNICTKEAVVDQFLVSDVYRKSVGSDRRTIFVFHCEFSSERAPSLLRFLRNQDRAAHASCYPKLHYPEIYLLAGGYKAFYESHVSMCRPPAYRPMLDADHAAELRHFRQKSKSWAGGRKQQQQQRVQGSARGTSQRGSGCVFRSKSLWM